MSTNAPAAEVTINGLRIALEDIARFAPIVSLHPAEPYLPCSVEALLVKSRLISAQSGATILAGPTQRDLAAHPGTEYQLALDAASFAGEPLAADGTVAAPMYISPQVPPDRSFVDLTFVFLFGYNGAQAARVNWLFVDPFNCVVPTFAEHQGDLEGITVRVSPQFDEVVFVRFEAHGDSTYYLPTEVDFDGTHPLVCCALNSHATYNGRGRNVEDWIELRSFELLGIGVDFVDIIHRDGPRWQPFLGTGRLILVGLDESGTPFGDQVWASFSGRLGARTSNGFTAARGVSKTLDPMQAQIVNSIGSDVTKLIGLLPAEIRDGALAEITEGNGPSGLGGRDFIHASRPCWSLPPGALASS